MNTRYDTAFVNHLFKYELYSELETYHALNFSINKDKNLYYYNWGNSRLLSGNKDTTSLYRNISDTSIYFARGSYLSLSSKFLYTGLPENVLKSKQFQVLSNKQQELLEIAIFHHENKLTQVDSILAYSLDNEELVGLFEVEKKMRKKSKFVTALLGLFPGGGKFYVGNPKAGFATLMGVSFLSIQAYDAYNKKGGKSLSFIGYSLLSSLFYIGSINGGIQQLNYNRNVSHEKVNNFIRFNLSISIDRILSEK